MSEGVPERPEAALAREIRVAREAAGLTQAALANRVGFSREYVSCAERASKGLASHELVAAIDAALGAEGVLVALRTRLHAQRVDRRRPARQPASCSETDTCSRPPVARPPTSTVPAVGRSASPDTSPGERADDLSRIHGIDHGEGPEHALPRVVALLDAIGRDLVDARGVDRGALLRIAARAAEFAGFLHRDLGDVGQCLYWHDRAMEFAQQAQDLALQAFVLLRKAQSVYDQRDAPRMLDLTLAAFRFEAAIGPGLRAELLQQQARGEAMLGAGDAEVRHRLDEARAALSTRDDQRTAYEPGRYYSERLLDFQTALCLTEAGHPAEAVQQYLQVIDAGLAARDRAYFSILMARSLALAGEPDEAARIACSSLPVAAAMVSRRSIREARTLVEVLAPWRGRHQVRQLQDALRSAEQISY